MEVDFAPEFVCDSSDLEELVSAAKDFCYSHGIIFRMAEDPQTQKTVRYFPFALLPTPVPRHCFQAAMGVQRDYNVLMHNVANDYDFLKECFESVINVDKFTRNLWTIYETVKKEGSNKPGFLEMNRSDYMMGVTQSQGNGCNGNSSQGRMCIKQVEFNTMSAASAGVGPKMVKLHRYVLSVTGHADKMDNIPNNDSCDGMAKALVTAWQVYNNTKAVILYFILPSEENTYDQKHIEYRVKEENPHITVVYRTLTHVQQRGSLDENNCLFVDGMEVAVIYQRCGYSPTHFKTQQDWDTRLLLERSRAIISPSINYHLAGAKKVQQVLAQPGVLERFLTDTDSVNRVRATITGLYSLDLNEEGDYNTANAMKNPNKYVLKPQREGGGNNMFGEDIRTTLESTGRTAERSAYILMDRICPYTWPNYAVSEQEELKLKPMTSELGVYGSMVGSSDCILRNEGHGFLLKNKLECTNEASIGCGGAVPSSPYLVDHCQV